MKCKQIMICWTLVLGGPVLAEEAPLSPEAMVAAEVRKYLEQETGLKPFQVQVTQLRFHPPVTDRFHSLKLIGLGTPGSKRFHGMLSTSAQIQTALEKDKNIQVVMNLDVIGPVAVAPKNLPKGHELKQADLVYKEMSYRVVAADLHGFSPQRLLGQRLRVGVESGQPIHPQLVEAIPLVNHGDPVQITIKSGGHVSIRVPGFARGSGSFGDLIRIEQADSRKHLQGRVRSANEVEIQL